MTDQFELAKIMPGAEPQFYRGGALGCLIVHGYMASPAEVGWLGAYLAKAGHTVYVPRLTGHGIDPLHMKRMRWQDWYAQALDGYHILRQQCDHVIVMGHSMGGLIASLIAASYPTDGLVIAASPFFPPDPRMSYAQWLDIVIPFSKAETEPPLQNAILAEQKRRGEPEIGRVNYRRWRTRPARELYLLMQVSGAYLPKITVPTLLLYAEHDETASLKNFEFAKEHIGSADLRTHLLAEGGHIMFQDVAREEAFAVVGDFITHVQQMKST